MNQTVEQILNGPDYFLCDRFKTRMKKADCVKRQGGFIPTYGTWQHDPNMGMSFEECVNCAQGKEIRAEVGNLKHEGRNKRKPPRLDIVKKVEAEHASDDSNNVGSGDKKMATKICNDCKKPKDLEKDFHKSKTSKDGRKGSCKTCVADYMRKLNAGKVGDKTSAKVTKPKAQKKVKAIDSSIRGINGVVTIIPEPVSADTITSQDVQMAENRGDYRRMAVAFINLVEKKFLQETFDVLFAQSAEGKGQSVETKGE